jgi:hypothetical protein
VILEDLDFYLLQPRLEESRLPEPGQVVSGVRTLQILVGGVFCVGFARADLRRRAWAELVAGREYPWMPRACER